MLSSVVLDVGIGLAFVYLLLAMLCMVMHEWIAGWVGLRAKTLREGIDRLLGEETAKDFYSHPLVGSLAPRKGAPSYVAASVFAEVVLDLPNVWRKGTRETAAISQSVEALKARLPKQVSDLLDVSGPSKQNLDQAKEALAKWFDQGMDRVSGWYRRWTQFRTVILAAIVTFLANADTLRIADRLWESPTLRARIVEEAKVRAAKPTPLLTADYPEPDDPVPSPEPRVDTEAQQGEQAREARRLSEEERALLGELTGWSYEFRVFNAMREDGAAAGAGTDPWAATPASVAEQSAAFPGRALLSGRGFHWFFTWLLPSHLLGWFLTVAAVSLGAPFWFDIQQTVLKMKVRSSGDRPGEGAGAR